MILPIHIAIASASLVFAAVTYFAPSRRKLIINYIFLIATIGTGFYLVGAIKPTHMASVCISGLTYLGIAGTAIYQARKKLIA